METKLELLWLKLTCHWKLDLAALISFLSAGSFPPPSFSHHGTVTLLWKIFPTIKLHKTTEKMSDIIVWLYD